MDVDLAKLFDTVNHDILMGLVDKHMEDKDIRRLIYVFLKSGVMTNGSMMATALGTPQGGLCKALHNEPYVKSGVMQSKLVNVYDSGVCKSFTLHNVSGLF